MVQANAGIAAYTRNDTTGVELGFWYDVAAGLYRQEGGIQVLSTRQFAPDAGPLHHSTHE